MQSMAQKVKMSKETGMFNRFSVSLINLLVMYLLLISMVKEKSRR